MKKRNSTTKTTLSAVRTNSVKRGAFDRMTKIYGQLQEGAHPNCTTIAQEFQVSLKTAARDIDFMRDRWALPIEYDDVLHGYYLSEPVQRLPWVPVTEAELFAVAVSAKIIDLYRGMPFRKPLELALAKITQVLDDDERYLLENFEPAFSFKPFAAEDPDLRVLELLMRAVAERHGLCFRYRKPGQKTTETRKVHPYHVVEFEGRMYLVGHDKVRRAVRTFAVGRMTELAVTPERFVRPKDFDVKKYFASGLGIMTGNGDYEVVIKLDAFQTDILRGRRLHRSQEVEELPDGASHLRLRLGCQYVLSWGTHATVLEPQELRERVGGAVRELARRYAAAGG